MLIIVLVPVKAHQMKNEKQGVHPFNICLFIYLFLYHF